MHLEILRIEMNYLKTYINTYLANNKAHELEESVLSLITSFMLPNSYDSHCINHIEKFEHILQKLQEVLDDEEYEFLIANTVTLQTLIEKIKFEISSII